MTRNAFRINVGFRNNLRLCVTRFRVETRARFSRWFMMKPALGIYAGSSFNLRKEEVAVKPRQ